MRQEGRSLLSRENSKCKRCWSGSKHTWSLMLGKIEGKRRRGRQRRRWLDSITDSVDMILSKLWEIVEDRGAWCACSPWGPKESDVTW